jgi:enoyl-CoA hydratase/carnithine racemase
MALLRTEDRGAVRHLILARADTRNALNGELIGELGGAVEAAAADEVRVLVLPGEEAMFSAGMDLNDLRALSQNAANLRRIRRPILARRLLSTARRGRIR